MIGKSTQLGEQEADHVNLARQNYFIRAKEYVISTPRAAEFLGILQEDEAMYLSKVREAMRIGSEEFRDILVKLSEHSLVNVTVLRGTRPQRTPDGFYTVPCVVSIAQSGRSVLSSIKEAAN